MATKKKMKEENPSIIVLDRFYPRPYTERILKEHKFLWEGQRGNLFHYLEDDGIWLPNGEDFIRLYFRRLSECILDTLRKKYFIEEIIADVQGYTYTPTGLLQPGLNLMPFKNGVYDLVSDSFRPYDAEDYFTWKLPHNYNPEAKCEFLNKLIDSFLPESESITLWELQSYCLWRGYPYQKFFFLYGKGCNGKTLFTKILTKLLGVGNVSCISLGDIQDNRFSAGHLHKKLANISGEVNYRALEDTRLLKQLSGEDYVDADVKFKNPIRFINYAKLIFLTNQIPLSKDTTDAFYRRIFLVEFPKQFKEDPAIPIRVETLSEVEWEGLLFEVLQYLKRLYKQKFYLLKTSGD